MAKIVIPKFDFSDIDTSWKDVEGDGSLYRFTADTSTFDTLSFQLEPSSLNAAVTVDFKQSNINDAVTEADRNTFPMTGDVYTTTTKVVDSDVLNQSINTGALFFESRDVTRGDKFHVELTVNTATTGSITFYDRLR
jgi:hypothetical protein